MGKVFVYLNLVQGQSIFSFLLIKKGRASLFSFVWEATDERCFFHCPNALKQAAFHCWFPICCCSTYIPSMKKAQASVAEGCSRKKHCHNFFLHHSVILLKIWLLQHVICEKAGFFFFKKSLYYKIWMYSSMLDTYVVYNKGNAHIESAKV